MASKGYIPHIDHQKQNGKIRSYILSIRSSSYSQRDLDLDPITFFALSTFVKNKCLSSYQIYLILDGKDDFANAFKEIRNKKHFLSYKNTRKKVLNLLSLGLIEIDKAQNTKHDAVYFKLSSHSIFYLIWRYSSSLIIHSKKLFKNYKNDELFRIFLYPYLGDCIDQIESLAIFDEVLNYLSIICDEIMGAKLLTRKEEIELFLWKKLLASDDYNHILLDYLSLVLNLEWLDCENPLIEKSKREDRIKILGKDHSIIINKDAQIRNNLLVIADGKLVHEFTLLKNGLIMDEESPVVDPGQDFSCNSLISIARERINLLLIGIVSYFESELESEWITQDNAIFARNKNFMQSLERLKNKIVTHSNMLSESAKSKVLPTLTKLVPTKIDWNPRYRKERKGDLFERLSALNFRQVRRKSV